MKNRPTARTGIHLPSNPVVQEAIIISYNWLFICDVVNATRQLMEDIEICSIGSTYEEAKDIAIHLLKRKCARVLQIKKAVSTGIRFAYYQEGKANIPPTGYTGLPAASIPKRL